MRIQQGQITAQIDEMATRAAYAALPQVTCACCYCRNFRLASPYAPKAVQGFLDTLGADVQKPAEAVCYPHPREAALRYCGIYHMVGEIVGHQTEASVDIPEASLDISLRWGLSPDLIRIARHVSLVEEGFPPPILQIEVWMDLPWALSEARPPQ